MRDWIIRHFAHHHRPAVPRVELKDLPLAVDKIRAIKGPLTKAVESVYWVGYADGAPVGIEAGVVLAMLGCLIVALVAVAVWALCRYVAWLTIPPVERGRAAARGLATLLLFGLVAGGFLVGSRVDRLMAAVYKHLR
jgi:hypothetical protein